METADIINKLGRWAINWRMATSSSSGTASLSDELLAKQLLNTFSVAGEYTRPPLTNLEISAMQTLRQMGKRVSTNPLEGLPGSGRQGDVFVNGMRTEIKTLSKGATSNTVKNVLNNSKRGMGQARSIFIDARGSGLSQCDSANAMKRVGDIPAINNKFDHIFILGDDFTEGTLP